MSLTKCIKTRPPSQHVLCRSTSLRLDEPTTKRCWSLGRTRRWTLRPATLGSADTARARARVRSRQRCARTQARKGIGRPREPSGLAYHHDSERPTTKGNSAERREVTHRHAKCQSAPYPRTHSAEGVEGRRMVTGCACGKQTPYEF